MKEIKVSVTWKYTSPRQYKEREYTFDNQEHYDTWYAKQISDEILRKIINLNELQN